MTVSVSTNRNEFIGNGSLVAYDYTFVAYSDSSIKIEINGVEQVSGFTVARNSNNIGGRITFSVAPANGAAIIIRREVPLTQTLDLVRFGRFPAESIERALDEGVMVDQQLQERIDQDRSFTESEVARVLAKVLNRVDGPNSMEQPINMGSNPINNLSNASLDSDAVNLGQAKEISQSSAGRKLVLNSADGFPNPNAYVEGTELKFYDTLDEYVLIRSETGELQWVEEGNVGDEVDITAASHLTLAQAQASDLQVGQYVRLTDRDNSLWKVTSDVADGYGVISVGSASLTLQVVNNLVKSTWFGDDTGDSTNQVRAMLLFGAPTVELVEGNTYVCTDTINKPQGVNLIGKGRLKFSLTSVGQYGLFCSGDTGDLRDIEVEDISLVANTEPVRLEDVTNLKVYFTKVFGGHYGISVKNTVGDYTTNYGLDISHNRVENTTSSGYDFQKVSDSIIGWNFSKNCGTDGYKFKSICKELTIVSNQARGCGRDGFDFYDGVTNSTIALNVAEDNALQGFECKGTIADGEYVFRGNTLTGNVAKGNGTSGYLLQSIRDCDFGSNKSFGNTQSGWVLNEIQGCTFSGDSANRNLEHGWNCIQGSRNIFNGVMANDNSWVDGTIQNGTFHGFNLQAAFDANDFTGCRALNGTLAGKKGGQGWGMNFGTGSSVNKIIGGRYDDNISGAFGGDKTNNHIMVFDTSSDLAITPAGAGKLKFGGHTTIGGETLSGYIEIKDSSGTVRKLAVIS